MDSNEEVEDVIVHEVEPIDEDTYPSSGIYDLCEKVNELVVAVNIINERLDKIEKEQKILTRLRHRNTPMR